MKNKKILLACLLLLMFIPMSFLVANKMENEMGFTPIEMNTNDNNFWNLCHKDEMIWQINDSLYFNDEKISETIAFLINEIIDTNDHKYDIDTFSDLGLKSGLYLGTENFRMGIDLNTQGHLDSLLFNIVQILTNFIDLSSLLNEESIFTFDSLFEMDVIPISYGTGLNYIYSDLWTKIINTITNTLIWQSFEFNRLNYWNFEIDNFNLTNNASEYGIFTYFDENSQNYMNIEPTIEREFSKGLSFHVNDHEEISLSDPNSYLVYYNQIREGNLDYFLRKSSLTSEYETYFYDYRVYIEPDTTILFDFTDISPIGLSMNDRENHETSQHIKIENGELFYLNKTYTEVYDHDLGDFVVQTDGEIDWIYVCDFPLNEWVIFTIEYQKERYSSTAGFFKIQIDHDYDYKTEDSTLIEEESFPITHNRDHAVSLELLYNSIILADSNSPRSLYIDDWGDIYSWYVYTEQEITPIDTVFLFNNYRDDLLNQYTFLSLFNPNMLLILPNPQIFDIGYFFNEAISLFRNMGLPLEITDLLLDIYTLSDDYFSIQITKENIESILSLIFGEGFKINQLYGEGGFSFQIIWDRNLGLMKSIEYRVDYENLNAYQITKIDLIVTKTINPNSEGFYYWDSEGERRFNDEPFTSRLYQDDYNDLIDPSFYSFELSLLIDSVIGRIDETLLFRLFFSDIKFHVLGYSIGVLTVTILVSYKIKRRNS